MAYGIVKQLSNLTHQQVLVPSGAQYVTMAVLNPNDGVLYVAKDRDCLGVAYGAWDWKVPSQSYALLPGPFSSLGIFYLDQSGSGHNGEVTLYGTFGDAIEIPQFHAIGRALIALQNTLDVTEGTIPANPAAGIVRVWADASGLLHVLDSTGLDDILVTDDDVQTLTNKTLVVPIIFGAVFARIGGITPPVGYVHLTADPVTFGIMYYLDSGGVKHELVTLIDVQTLTNKTLTSPILNGGVLVSGSYSGTFTMPTGAPTAFNTLKDAALIKAHGVLNLIAGVPTLASSYNVASVTDNAVGDVTIGLTNGILNEPGPIVASLVFQGGTSATVEVTMPTSSSIRLLCRNSATGALMDPNQYNFIACGRM